MRFWKKKAQPENYQPAITATTRELDGAVEIRVKDNGLGIPEENLNKVFQPFFTTRPAGEDTGLGLSLAYDIVIKGHGGRLEVESAEAAGTEFVLTFKGRL